MTHARTPAPAALPAASAAQILPPLARPAGRTARCWTPAVQAEFLRQLGATHCVGTAARAVGMSRQSAYRLRNRLKGQPFDVAWACAFRRQYDALAEAALSRALNGVEVPHYHKGELVGTHRVFDERLTVALLAMQHRLTPLPPTRAYEHMMAPPDDFEALLARVAQGPEHWSEAAG